MFTKTQKPLAVLLVLALFLAACSPAANPPAAPVVTDAPIAAVQPTAAPTQAPVVVETEAPVVEVAPDFQALFTDLVAAISEKGFAAVGAAKLNEELADKAPFLLDVREAAEVEKDGYIAGSVNIPIRSLLQNLDKLPGLDEPIVIYCASGHRGGLGLSALQLLGYSNVRNLGGGLGAWKKAGLAVETGSMPAAAAAISTPVVEDETLFNTLNEWLSGMPDGFFAAPAAKINEMLAGSPAPLLVDVRAQAEIDKDGYIEGGLHLPMDKFMTTWDQLPADKDAPVVIYCASGHRGAIAMMAMRMAGYTNVTNLGGGLGAWKAAKLPVAGWTDWASVWPQYLSSLPAGQYAIKAGDLNTLLAENAPFILDLREAGEVEANGYIAGAVHMPFREVFKNLDKLPAKDQPIVLICASGHRGGLVLPGLNLLGYTNVRNLAGGMGAWIKAELPVEKDAIAAPTAGTMPEVDAALLRDLDAFISSVPDNLYAIKSPDLNTLLSGTDVPTLIDVRTPEEFANGYIAGSIHIPINELLVDLSKLPADKAAPIVMVCQSGHRGAIGLVALRMLGYTNVLNLGGGVNAWGAAELPLQK